MTKNILLTTVCRPIGPRYGDAKSVGYELMHGQVTRAQGLFSLRSVIHHFSLEYVAHNLDSPTVVLQYPSKREFIQEIRKGYDYVGISFVLSTFHHMKDMVALVREHSPHSKIILGGYGTVINDDELKPYGDYFCRGEGVSFIRKVLGEPERPMPYGHPLIVNGLKVFSLPIGDNGMIFGGLGCPNGCDFCCTSHFFKRKHIRLLPEGDHIFNVMQNYRKKDPHMKFTVLDEDFLLNQKRARRFLELVRESKKEPPSMFVFASVKALSQYTVRELLEMGVTGVWIGYEGTRSGYAKQQGRDVSELLKELREHGIHVLASFIVGFDYQTPEIVEEELKGLMDLVPTFTQILIYGPTPGTPFYDRIQSEGRLVKNLQRNKGEYYKKCTGFYGMIQHPTLTSEDWESIQEECYRKDFHELGPSLIRSVESWYLGYKKLIHDKSELMRKRAEIYKRDILNALPIFWTARILGPSRKTREEAKELYEKLLIEFRAASPLLAIKSAGAFVMACWTSLCLRMDWFQHPRLTRSVYRMN